MTKLTFREAEHAGWSARAESYDAVFVDISNQAIPHMLTAMAAAHNGDLDGCKLLDLCCGPGHLAAAAAMQGAQAEGLDFAEPMVVRAQHNYPNTAFRQGDAEDLPYDAEAFDAVACAFGVMHLPDPDRCFAEALRVLRPGGVFAFTQWAIWDELFGIVGTAVAAHGRRDVELPAAPSLMRFSDPAECQRTLLAHSFEVVSVTMLDLVWIGAEPEDVLVMIHGGAVRASMLIEAQPPEHRNQVEAAIVDAVRSRPAPDGSGFLVRRPAVLAVGKRPKR